MSDERLGASVGNRVTAQRVREAYAPPAHDSQEREYDPATDSPATLVTVVTGLLLLQGVVLIGNASCRGLVAARLLSRPVEAQLLEASRTLAVGHTLLFLVGAIPFALFLVGANETARALVQAGDSSFDTGLLQFTPGSMAWWFFVPILCLIKPYEAVRAVWSASTPFEGEPRVEDSSLRAWFGTWILYWVVSRLNAFVGPQISMQPRSVLIVVTDALGVLACL